MPEPSHNLFPIALDLRGRRCVVVGGGSVGFRKAEALVEARADVVVVAPECVEGLRSMVGIERIAAPFVPAHLEDAFLAVAATDSRVVNDAVVAAARARNILVNQASDDADAGDFATMATIRRGDLLVALTTGGAGPALSARLRRRFDAEFGPEWGAYVALLGELRATAKRAIPDPAARTAALRKLAAADSVRERIAAGDPDGARDEAEACLA